MYSFRLAAQHSNKLFKVTSICFDKFSEPCDQRTCKRRKHCSVVDASCSADNSLVKFFSRVHLVWAPYLNKILRTILSGGQNFSNDTIPTVCKFPQVQYAECARYGTDIFFQCAMFSRLSDLCSLLQGWRTSTRKTEEKLDGRYKEGHE